MTILAAERIAIIGFEALALFAGVLTWKKFKSTPMNKFILYLAFIVIAEITGNIMVRYKLKEENNILFTYLVIPAEYLFFFYLFYTILKSKWQKRLVIVSTALLLISMLYEKNFLKDGETYSFESFSYSVSNILLLIIIIAYLISFVRSDQILFYKNNPVFWIALGLLFFYLGSFPLFAMYHYLWALDKKLFLTYWHVVFVLNCIMYCLFSISFLWGRPGLIYSL